MESVVVRQREQITELERQAQQANARATAGAAGVAGHDEYRTGPVHRPEPLVDAKLLGNPDKF
eukprot:5902607-Pyramimonas_sp.AAC.1